MIQTPWYLRNGFRKAIIWITFPTILASVAVLFIRGSHDTLPADTTVLAEVKRQTATFDLTGSGELVRRLSVSITAPTDGTLKELMVTQGVVVGAGTPLATIENIDLELASHRAENELELARVESASNAARLSIQFETQSLDVERATAEAEIATSRAEGYRKLSSADLVSKVALKEYELAERLAALKVSSERHKLESIRREMDASLVADRSKLRMAVEEAKRASGRLAELVLRAPFAGVVDRFHYAARASVNRGAEIASFAGDGGLDARISVLERSAGRIRVGMMATILSANKAVPAKVYLVDGQVENGVVGVTLRPLRKIPADWRPGQQVEGVIQIERAENALVVARPQGVRDESTAFVLVKVPDQQYLVSKKVAFGIGSGKKIQVRSGLEAGDSIVVSDVGEISAANKKYRLE